MATPAEAPAIRVELNPEASPQASATVAAGLGEPAARGVRSFHTTVAGYAPTALVTRSDLATAAGVDRVWVKDESTRFGLGSFKGLGTTWAMARVAERRGHATGTVVTATDGNHGRAVAWAARARGMRAVVYLPREASGPRVRAIEAEGARAERIPGSYDDAVARAARDADARGWVLVQDTAWVGYTEVPWWIMQGYLTTLDEALEQVDEVPTHLFLQCGVGSFAGAVAGGLAQRFGGRRPRIVIVEPSGAACALAAVTAAVDSPPALTTPPHTFMACLSCARLSLLGWRILRLHADAVVTAADEIARRGMRLLARGDAPVISGESGAVTAGLLPELVDRDRERLGLDATSRVLLFSTEGATDPEIYARVIGDAQ